MKKNDNHSIAYCLLGYLCAYFRYYHPLEFLTSFLNNAANDDDIRNGTAYAEKIGIKITMPKWGFSKGEYFFNAEKRLITKGLSSIKYMGGTVAEELYNLANTRQYRCFVDVLSAINQNTSLNARQLDILIKLDFFSDFGNQRELLRITDMFYNTFKAGDAKQIKKTVVDGTPLEDIVKRYAVGVTKSGGVAKSYTLLNVMSIMRDVEALVKQMHFADLSDIVKVQNFYDAMGYIGYVSGKAEDRRKLYVTEIKPIHRKSDNKKFGYSVFTKSIGSGKESRFTVFSGVYDKNPITKGDIIYCQSYERDGKYFRLTAYSKII